MMRYATRSDRVPFGLSPFFAPCVRGLGIRREDHDSWCIEQRWPRLGNVIKRSVNVITFTIMWKLPVPGHPSVPFHRCRLGFMRIPCFRPPKRRTYRIAEPPGRVNKLRQHDLSFTSLPFLIASMSVSALQLQSYTSHLKPYDLFLMAYLVVLGILCLKLRPVSAVSCKLGRLSNSLFLLSCTALAPSTVIHTLPFRMNR